MMPRKMARAAQTWHRTAMEPAPVVARLVDGAE